ncbi:hypothetical protein VNO77_02649 [Canavalia gladiata]|uniref:Uncharacterized protein n=1 Tax=Canavalia gladiata TaxID=3824 RepID=A0AAN9MVF8_CANGL
MRGTSLCYHEWVNYCRYTHAIRYPQYRESEQRREQGEDLNPERPQGAPKVREDFQELEKEIQIQGASPKLR